MSKALSSRHAPVTGPASPADARDRVVGQAAADTVGQVSETVLQRQLRLARKVLIEQADALRELAKH